MPLSCTVSSAPAAVRRSATWIQPPSTPNLKALSSRFCTTREMRKTSMSMKMPGSAAQLMRMPRRATMACSSQMTVTRSERSAYSQLTFCVP